jgi:K+-transporting ATPase ATPase A chain
MTGTGLSQLALLLALLLLITRPLGSYLVNIFLGNRTFLSTPLLPLERFTYRACRIDPEVEQTWTSYAASCIAFGLLNFIVLYLLLRVQHLLPLNPEHFGMGAAPSGSVPLTPDLAFNIAVSFMTNTSWQSYPGEMTLSYLSQMLGIAVQSFTSTAAGIAVTMAVIRGFARERTRGLGNFWVDVTRATVYILLPLSVVAGMLLCSMGVIQNLRPYERITTIESASQTVAAGPVASQEAIKLLSAGEGGGFFNANSAHPLENPTPLANFLAMLLMLSIPAAMTYAFGRMVGDRRQGWTLFGVMAIFLAAGSCLIGWSERSAASTSPKTRIERSNMEGKEVRFGSDASALFSAVSTASSDGAMNSTHGSFAPMSILAHMFNFTTGELIFGGAGTGLISMMLMVVLTVFIAGLMVGRSPEYLGKKIEAKEIKLVMLSHLATSAPVLIFTAASLLVHFHAGGYWNPPGPVTANLANLGPRGLSELLYASASATANNGSALSGFNANTPWFNLVLGLAMLIGRFMVIVPALALAGSVVRKKRMTITSGTLPTYGLLFAGLLSGAIVLVTALTFFPAFSLGPLAENFVMKTGGLFP